MFINDCYNQIAEVYRMSQLLAESIKRLRKERGLSQQQLADMLYVDRSSIAHWELGRRVPDAEVISRLSQVFNVDVNSLMDAASDESVEKTNVIIVDDEKIILQGGMPVIESVLPDVRVTGFQKPSEAIAFANSNKVDLAFLDVEMGSVSGLDLCRELLIINPQMNIIFLTAHTDYSVDAWNTGACGFLLKPIGPENIKKQLKFLRYPIKGLARLV